MTPLLAGCSKSEEAPQQEATSADETSALAPEVAVPAKPEADETEPGPAFASPTPAANGRPPDPAIPAPLGDPEPTPGMRASTSFRWLPGHWIWTGNQYVWQPGVWVYDVPGHTLVPPRWVWDGEHPRFEDAGWAAAGSARISFRPTAVPSERAEVAPEPDLQAPDVDVYVAPSTYAVYVWTGTWTAPAIIPVLLLPSVPAASPSARTVEAPTGTCAITTREPQRAVVSVNAKGRVPASSKTIGIGVPHS